MNLSQIEVLINKTHWPVTALGYGKRVGVWFQGCSIGCKGCCSKDTWQKKPTTKTTINSVTNWINSLPKEEIDGFTITGGEPFDQPQALRSLIEYLKRHYPLNKDILVYSGYPYKILKRKYPDIVEMADIIISEPFKESLPVGFLSGSNNQKIYTRTTLASERYSHDKQQENSPKKLQVHFDGEQLFLIGIPNRGDLDVLKLKAEASGVTLSNTSWEG